MIKMYMQLLLTLGSFFGFVISSLWLTMTYVYASKILAERGVRPVYNWFLINSVAVFLILCVVAFVFGVQWVRRSKHEEREKRKRYRELFLERKEAEASY